MAARIHRNTPHTVALTARRRSSSSTPSSDDQHPQNTQYNSRGRRLGRPGRLRGARRGDAAQHRRDVHRRARDTECRRDVAIWIRRPRETNGSAAREDVRREIPAQGHGPVGRLRGEARQSAIWSFTLRPPRPGVRRGVGPERDPGLGGALCHSMAPSEATMALDVAQVVEALSARLAIEIPILFFCFFFITFFRHHANIHVVSPFCVICCSFLVYAFVFD